MTSPSCKMRLPAIAPDSENFIGTFIGRSDGRCVQRAGTYSMRVDDSRLQGIPRYKTNNCKSLSLARCEFKRLAEDPLGQADMLVARISVARVRPRTSKGITDLLLPQTSSGLKHIAVPLRSLHPAQGRATLFSRLGSRSLTELTRQITPPTKNGHAPPPIESRKSFQSVNPYYVRTW